MPTWVLGVKAWRGFLALQAWWVPWVRTGGVLWCKKGLGSLFRGLALLFGALGLGSAPCKGQQLGLRASEAMRLRQEAAMSAGL